jgi:hypothetical protein
VLASAGMASNHGDARAGVPPATAEQGNWILRDVSEDAARSFATLAPMTSRDFDRNADAVAALAALPGAELTSSLLRLALEP